MNRFVLNEISYHGSGAIKAIPDEIKSRGFNKAFVVSDQLLVEKQITGKVTGLLETSGIAYCLFDNVKSNPTVENIRSGIERFRICNADCIVAVGGGSSIDTAKAIGIVIANPEFSDIHSLEGTAKTKNPSVPVIAVPTTAGTAAEVTVNYVITDSENKRKFVCVDPHDIPIVAVVDPDMMASMPPLLTAYTGLDALTHAIEGYITLGAWELSDMFHLKAIELISRSLRPAVRGEKTGRNEMALAQYIAGMGFSNVGLGIDHSMAHMLSAYYDMPHGMACAVLLPAVMEYNAAFTGVKYREIARAMGVADTEEMTSGEYRSAAINAVRKLSEDVGIPDSLEGIISESDIPTLSAAAYNDACRPGNPRNTSIREIEDIYRSLL